MTSTTVKPANYDRIVSYGCSHMCGLETADEDIIPNATEIKKKEGYISFRERIGKNDQSYIERNKEYSWIKLLADDLNLKLDNRALPGNSIQNIIWSIENDLVRNLITDNDLIIVDLVTPFRNNFFVENKFSKHLNFGIPVHWWHEKIKPIAEDITRIFDKEKLFFDWCLSLEALQRLASTRLKGQLYFTFPERIERILNRGFDQQYSNVLNRILNDILDSEYLILKTAMFNLVKSTDDMYTTPGHVKRHIHTEWAEKVKTELVNKGIINEQRTI